MVANAYEFPRIYEEAVPVQPISILTPAPHNNGDITHEGDELETMPPTKAQEAEAALRESIHTMTLAITAMARVHSEAKPVPTKGETMKAWAPTMLTMVVLAVSFVRFDAKRETSTGYEVGDLRAKYEQVLVDLRKTQNNLVMLETYQREMERAVIQGGSRIKLPAYPVLTK